MRKKGVNKVVQSTEEVNDKFKALEKAHQDLQAAHQRALAFGEMMSQLCQGNLGTKATTLEEWEPPRQRSWIPTQLISVRVLSPECKRRLQVAKGKR